MSFLFMLMFRFCVSFTFSPPSLHWLFIACLLVGVSGCGKKVDLEDPETYSKGAINFKYPSNWDIDQEVVESDIHYVVISSPGQGLFVVQAHISDFAMELEDFSTWFSEEARANTPLLTRSEGVFSPITKLPSPEFAEGRAETFNISLFGQHVPHRAEYFLARGEKLDAFVITQYREEIAPELAPGYRLIFDTLQFEPSGP